MFRDVNKTDFMYPKAKSQDSTITEIAESLTGASFRAVDSVSNSESDEQEGLLHLTGLSSDLELQKFRFFNISPSESFDESTILIGKLSLADTSSDTTETSQIIPKRELETSPCGSSELKQSNISLGKRPHGICRMPASKIDTAKDSSENSRSSDEGPLQCRTKKKRSFKSEQKVYQSLSAQSLEECGNVLSSMKRSQNSPRKRRISGEETKEKYRKRSVSVKDSETGEKSNIVIRSRSLSLDLKASPVKLDKISKSSPKAK
ncbi:hypothetical protein TNCT_36601 [Trichonephila clavata]|uniref:Uncharacterized protein n=1 Tax=Trichonephila clavata TaxID=2740835 RepID=A0A8X6FNU7_TRICU|nr:hypothetical protein TNCT_36601 [Trichonephila clavata]